MLKNSRLLSAYPKRRYKSKFEGEVEGESGDKSDTTDCSDASNEARSQVSIGLPGAARLHTVQYGQQGYGSL